MIFKNSISHKTVAAVLIPLCAVFVLSSCGDRTKKQDDAAAAEGSIANQKDEAIDSTPMSFDAQGSDSGKINGLVTVNFEYDKSSLSSEARKKLQGNVEWMKAHPKSKVQIEGHTDSRGSIEYNLALGERRANAVKNYMVSAGIAGDRLSTISFGEEKPIDTKESEAAWARNRRANFVPGN